MRMQKGDKLSLTHIYFSVLYIDFYILYFYLDVNGVYIICNTKLYSTLKPHRI